MSKFFILFDLIFQQFVSYNKNPFRCFVDFWTFEFSTNLSLFSKANIYKEGEKKFNFI